MKMQEVRCRLCGTIAEALQRDNGHIALCACGGERDILKLADGYGPTAAHGDDIPGGMTFKHGICNEDGTPRTFYSRREIREACKAAGIVSMADTGQQVPVATEEIEQNFKRSGYEQATRWPAVPGSLNPEMEAERVRHWHEHEAQLQQEMK